jgi:asparagine synthase (glutamine-hydrolysing)
MVNRLMLQEGVPVEQIGQRQKTFSAVYDTIGPYNEREHIARVLQATNAEENFVFPTLERLRTEVERLVWHQDEPFQSTSIFAQWCVMSKVRERGVTVLLDGQGADEALGGYRPFPILLGDLIRQAQYIRALAEARAIQDKTGLPTGPLLLRALARQLPQAWTQELRQRRWARQADVSVLQPDFASSQETNTADQVLSWPDLTSNLIDLVQESSLPHLLRYEDRNSMAFGIEARVPYLDYRLVRFAFEQAADWRIHQGWTKWILRKAMDGIVPREIVWRKDKVGFETPEVAWLREWLGLEPDLWGSRALCSKYLNMEAALKRVALWTTRGGDARPIWRWINLEIWLRIWQQPSPRSATLLSGV